MHFSYILNLFLYFPEDKMEYIPAVISFTIFAIAAVLTFRLIIRASKKEELKTRRQEEEASIRPPKEDS
ncbi:hypothetical protein JOC86_002797 [Bacillus pakistanensis]|uniref:Uncharacterized protein n=1 Tax=Rossellomorea pakistanensis TaxID=992288 RepID=A0ABS2NEL4_9BACI|nr:hypothetical protein [Bacillus pakistanensis]MBM7586255.1 hypothetical protein [Bacillus pakistanensis]